MMSCKYDDNISCERAKLVCNGCTIKQAIMDERKRVNDILDQYKAEVNKHDN